MAISPGAGRSGEQVLLERRQDARRLRPVGPRAHAEVDVRLRDAELSEEDVGHPFVVVLAGVHEARREARVAAAVGTPSTWTSRCTSTGR